MQISSTASRLLRSVIAGYPLLLLAVLWEAASRSGLVHPIFLPPLSRVLTRLFELMTTGQLFEPLAASLFRAFSGLLLAMAAGVLFGFLMARSRVVEWLLNPVLTIGFPAPKVAFLPIFVLWFGIDHLSKIALVTAFCVFPLTIAAHAGAARVPRAQIWAARAMGASSLATLWLIVLPASLPSLMSGVRVAVPYALVSAFTAEMIAGGGGLGGDLVYAQRNFESETVFAVLIVMLIVGYAFDHGALLFRRHVLRWHDED
jgi:ABC-type nitrate/sulfonate/bicarbonate transport system permease component